MKKMIQIRNNIITILCVTIVLLGIGFIVLSIELEHKKDEVHSYNVSFIDVSKKSSVKGSNIEPIGKAEIMEDGKEIEMSFTMNAFHDELVYVTNIKNEGTIPVEIVDIIESPDYSLESFKKLISPVSVSLTNIKGKIILPGETVELKITAYYNPNDSQVAKKTIPYKIGLITKSK